MTRRPRRVSRQAQILVALGLAVSVLFGSGVISIVSDSVRSTGNSLRSGTYAATAQTHDLAIARGERGSSCADAIYTDGPMTAAISDEEIDLADGSVAQLDAFCLRNFGTATGVVTVTMPLADYQEAELGPCEDSEAVGDTSCALDDRGELSGVVETAILPSDPSTSESCTGSGWGRMDDSHEIAVLDGFLDAGETCEVYLAVRVPVTEPDVDRLIAQTDRLQFDIVFTLQDDAPSGSGDF